MQKTRKFLNLIALVVLLSVQFLTPISYAEVENAFPFSKEEVQLELGDSEVKTTEQKVDDENLISMNELNNFGEGGGDVQPGGKDVADDEDSQAEDLDIVDSGNISIIEDKVVADDDVMNEKYNEASGESHMMKPDFLVGGG